MLTAVAPVAVEYLPAPQLIQVEFSEAPVAVEYVPAPQSVQLALPAAALYFPAAHAVHAGMGDQPPPSGPVNPMLHLQAVTACCPSKSLTVLEGHGGQLHCPLPEPHLFTGQSLHRV